MTAVDSPPLRFSTTTGPTSTCNSTAIASLPLPSSCTPLPCPNPEVFPELAAQMAIMRKYAQKLRQQQQRPPPDDPLTTTQPQPCSSLPSTGWEEFKADVKADLKAHLKACNALFLAALQKRHCTSSRPCPRLPSSDHRPSYNLEHLPSPDNNLRHVTQKETWICGKLPPPPLLPYGMSHARITSPGARTNLDTQLLDAKHSTLSSMPDLPEPPPFKRHHSTVKQLCMTISYNQHAPLPSFSPSNLPFYFLSTKPFLLASIKMRRSLLHVRKKYFGKFLHHYQDAGLVILN